MNRQPTFLLILLSLTIQHVSHGQAKRFRENRIEKIHSSFSDSVARLHDRLVIKLADTVFFDSAETNYYLIVNDIPYKNVTSETYLMNEELQFNLDNVPDRLQLIRDHYRFGVPTREVLISVADSKGEFLNRDPVAKANFKLNIFDPIKVTGGWILNALVFIAFLYFCIRLGMIKDSGTSQKGTFSLSRTQLAWWTILVFTAYVYLVSVTMDVNHLNTSTVILLGISAVTTLAGQVAGQPASVTTSVASGTAAPSSPPTSKGFWRDLLSENKDGRVSIHRFQSVIFNLALGLHFLLTAVATLEFPEYSSEVLTLLGISSATYAGIKSYEKNSGKQAPTP